MQVNQMLELVKRYQAKLGYDYDYETDEARMTHIRELTLALFQEVSEFIDWTPWKPWRAVADQEFNKREAALELIDVFFFMANLWSAIGMTPDEFHNLFMFKLEENLDRISRGYNSTRQNDEKQGVLPL